MIPFLFLYFVGLLTVLSLLVLWFYSPLKTTISEMFLGKTLMPHEFDDWLYFKNKWAGKLATCWICCSFWLSLVVGTIITILFSSVIIFNGFALITFFTYPAIAFLYYKIVN
jgi:hypothetical protein